MKPYVDLTGTLQDNNGFWLLKVGMDLKAVSKIWATLSFWVPKLVI